jgi:hypothetical protein
VLEREKWVKVGGWKGEGGEGGGKGEREGGRKGGREEGREEATKNRELLHGGKGGRREKVAEEDQEAKAYDTNMI